MAREAHNEHLSHAMHARHIPREGLVECACVLPDEAWPTVGRHGLARVGAVMWRCVAGAMCMLWRVAYVEHQLHGGHPRGIPRERQVECVCPLPSTNEARTGGRGHASFVHDGCCLRGVGAVGREGGAGGGARHLEQKVHVVHRRGAPVGDVAVLLLGRAHVRSPFVHCCLQRCAVAERGRRCWSGRQGGRGWLRCGWWQVKPTGP